MLKKCGRLLIAGAAGVIAGYLLGRHGPKDAPQDPVSVVSFSGDRFRSPSSSSGRGSSQALSEKLSRGQLKSYASQVLREPDSCRRGGQWLSILAEMDASTHPAILEALQERHGTGVNTRWEGEMLQSREGAIFGERALDGLPKEPNGRPGYADMNKMRGWSGADPREALKWAESLEPGNVRSVMLEQWKAGLKDADPQILGTLFNSLDRSLQKSLIPKILDGEVDGGGGIARWYETNAASLDPGVRQAACNSLISRMTQDDTQWDAAIAFVKNESATIDPATLDFSNFTRRIAGKDPGKCIELWASLAEKSPAFESKIDTMISQTVEFSSANSINTMAVWLRQNTRHPLYDKTVGHLARRAYQDDPQSALGWAETISDADLKAQVIASFPAKLAE